MNQNINNDTDETLIKQLKAYGEGAPQRNPEAAKHTRDRFLAELDILPNPTSTSLQIIIMNWIAGLKQQKENLAMLSKQRSAMTVVSTFLVFVVFLFGGGGLTAYAASAALPGDALYPVKTSLENARAGMTGNPEDQANLFIGFAGKRLEEIRALITEGRFSGIDATAAQFEQDIQKALAAIQKLSETDPVRAAELSASVAHILKGYSDSLSTLLAGVPQDVQPVIQNALNASQSAEAGNSNDDNSNANINDDNGGNSNDDNSNANINDDNGGNSNDDNSNANINDNANGNGNDDSGGGSGNGNSNDNGGGGNGNDDNGNDSGGGGNGNDNGGGSGGSGKGG